MAIESAMCDTHNVIVIVVFSRDIFQCMCDFINSHDIKFRWGAYVAVVGGAARPAIPSTVQPVVLVVLRCWSTCMAQ